MALLAPLRRTIAAWLRPRDPRHARGAAGERAAAKFLRAHGLEILANNLRTPRGELDLLAREGDCLVIVEVKVLASAGGTPAKLQVDRAKRERLRAGAVWAAKRRRWTGSVRIDVLAKDGEREWEWIKGAVEPGGRG